MIREVCNRSMVLLSTFVPLYIGLGVTANARTDFQLVISSSSSSISFTKWCISFKLDLAKFIPQY